jgi:hypothetical protein
MFLLESIGNSATHSNFITVQLFFCTQNAEFSPVCCLHRQQTESQIGANLIILVLRFSPLEFSPLSGDSSLCGGGLEYLHCSLLSRRMWQKRNPVPGDIFGPLCHWEHKYRDLVLQDGGWTQGWWLSSIKITVAKYKYVKTGSNLAERLLLKKSSFANDDKSADFKCHFVFPEIQHSWFLHPGISQVY